MKPIQTGIERLFADPPEMMQGKRLGLLTNAAAVNRKLEPTSALINKRFPGQLKALFAPQHGFFVEKQDNMVPSQDFIHPTLNVPVFSLYGDVRIPTQSMLDRIDVLIVDLQDVGTRVYTFIYTMAFCMQAARANGKQVIVLDRPNPVGGNRVEGNCLKPDHASFVGMYPIPMRHGLTIGELALLFNHHFRVGCELTVVPMAGWKRQMLFHETGLPWILPSPNLPTPISALVYPGQVLWEGTNMSEGRGTTQPFEIFGAPFLDVAELEACFSKKRLPGVRLRSLVFEPTYNKWSEKLCRGFQLHITNVRQYRPYRTTLTLLQAVSSLHPHSFRWKAPPYEFEYERLPFDLITGDPLVRRAIEGDEPLDDLEESWQDDLKAFDELRRAYALYQ